MRIRWGQDLATGLLFIVIGLGALIIGWDYPRGSPQRPGTGVLPAILSWCLIGTGGLLMIKSILAGDIEIDQWSWRPFILVTLGVVVFGLTVDDLGLVIAMVLSMSLCALGTVETRWWPEFWIFSVIMIAIGVGMFILLLGMPINTWPTRFPTFISAILR